MKTYLIVGSSGSLGAALVKLLLEKGDSVILTTSKIKNKYGENEIHLDLTDPDSIDALITFQDKLDGIIFTAGYEPRASLMEMTREHVTKMLDIHLTGPINTIKNIYKNLNKNSAIILVSSVAAYKGSYDPMYAIVKGGILSATRTFAVAFAKDAIRVNCIAPGLIEGSPVFMRMTDDFKEKHLNNTLNKKLTSALDCAETMFFLLKQEQINGQIIHINGGQYYGN